MKLFTFTVSWKDSQTGKVHNIPVTSSHEGDARRRRDHARRYFNDSVHVSEVTETAGKVSIHVEKIRETQSVPGNGTPNLSGIGRKSVGRTRAK